MGDPAWTMPELFHELKSRGENRDLIDPMIEQWPLQRSKNEIMEICQAHGCPATSHRVTNVLITLDGDRAGSEAYVIATLRRKDGNRLLQATACGRYLDRWSRREGCWAIDRRLYVHDFDEVREITETALPGGRPSRSRRPVLPCVGALKLGIEGRKALIAGSSSGIGAGIAAMLASEGVEVLVHGRSRAKAEAVVAGIRAQGAKASALIGALDVPEVIERLAREALATGPIDILISSAGAATSARGWFDVPMESWQQQFQFSMLYAVQLIRVLVPAMRERRRGRVLNISTGAAFKPTAFHREYSAAKLALHTVACSPSRELGDFGVTINTLISGVVMTENTRAMMTKTAEAHGLTATAVELERRVLRDVWRSAIPLARAGRVEELAAAACFLVSEHASYITGASLRIDGGGAGYVNGPPADQPADLTPTCRCARATATGALSSACQQQTLTAATRRPMR